MSTRTQWVGLTAMVLAGIAALAMCAGCGKSSPQTTAPTTGMPSAGAGGGAGRSMQSMPVKMRLAGLFTGIGRLEEQGGEQALSATQAQDILNIVSPLRTKATLTDEEADTALTQLQATLTSAQVSTIA